MFNKNETEKLFIVLNRIMNSLYLIVLATQEQNKIHKLN